MYPKISINICTSNSMAYIPNLLESIFKQTVTDFHVLIVDNGSTDGIEKFLREKFPEVTFIRNVRNLGFTGAHNQGIRYVIEHWGNVDLNDKFILVAHPEIIFTPTFLEKIVQTALQKDLVGVVGGKLLRAYGEGLHDEILKETIKSDRIDSVGLRLRKDFTCTNVGTGEMDEGQYQTSEEVFGFSDALVLYRASALQDIRYKDEFFDQDFFQSQEDLDMAWRMQYAGWQAWYEPEAIAYHYRGVYEQEKKSIWSRMLRRKTQSRRQYFFAVRNRLLILVKDLDCISFIFLFPRLFIVGGYQVLFALLFDWQAIYARIAAIRRIPKIWEKRRMIQQTKKVPGRVIRKKFTV